MHIIETRIYAYDRKESSSFFFVVLPRFTATILGFDKGGTFSDVNLKKESRICYILSD
jgi:hypothetical protein